MAVRSLEIVILSQFFYPEIGAPAARFLDFSRQFIARGHRVTVLTGFPNFPSGRLHKGYEGQMYRVDDVDGIRVVRTWLYTSSQATVARKALGYASFVASSSLAGILAPLDIDVLVATAPPPTIGLPALIAASRRGVPLIYDLRDLWPEAVVLSGRLRNPAIIRGLERLNRRVYDRAAAVTTVSEGKRDRLIEWGVEPSKVHVIPNGVDITYFDQCAADHADKARALRQSVGLRRDDVVLTYAGIMNPPQGLDLVLDSAAAVQHSDFGAHLRFLLIGSGSRRAHLEQRVREQGLQNVRFLPEQPRATVYALLAQAAATLVPLRPRRDTHTVPSKLFECFAAGSPVLLSADAEPVRLVNESGGGWATPAGDLDSFIDSLRQLAASVDGARERGEAGRAYVERHYDRDHLSARFLGVIETAAAASGRV